ncbi:MAG: hypothetical protein ACK5P7_03455 [Bdellovibrio sp.]|jgi:hypothetical protein
MKLTKLVVLSLFVGLAACSKPEDKKKPSVEIPDQLAMGGPSGSGMTLEQKADLKRDFSNSRAILAIDMAYQPRDESQEDYRKRMDKLAKATRLQKEVIHRIQSFCEITQPEQKTQNPSDLKVGAQAKSAKTSSISGSSCNVRSSSNTVFNMTITESDISSTAINRVDGKIEGSLELESALVELPWSNPNWLVNSNIVSLNLRGSFSGGVRFENASNKQYVRGGLDGYYESRTSGRIAIKGEFESLTKENGNQKQENSIMILNLMRGQTPAQIYISKSVTNGTKTEQTFLNGQPISASEVEEIFQGYFGGDQMFEN